VIVLAVRWYLRSGLSYPDVEELLAERGVEVDLVTIRRWVRRFTLLLADAARFARHRVGNRWHVDETYVKVVGRSTNSGRSSTSTHPRAGTQRPPASSFTGREQSPVLRRRRSSPTGRPHIHGGLLH
jgi:hypothetical protein